MEASEKRDEKRRDGRQSDREWPAGNIVKRVRVDASETTEAEEGRWREPTKKIGRKGEKERERGVR